MNKLYKLASAGVLIACMTGCLDFDTPADEFAANEDKVDGVVYSGDADKLDFRFQPTEEQVDSAVKYFNDNNYLGNILNAQYYLLGSKDGQLVSSHAYQYNYNLCVDNYCGYTTVINSSFMGGFVLDNTYSYVRDCNEGPYGKIINQKNLLGNPLNVDYANYIVELKAICLMLFDYAAQETVDLYGAIPFSDHLSNKETNPYAFEKGIDVYEHIIQNINAADSVFANFESRPAWYKDEINKLIQGCDGLTQDRSIASWRRFANSLKLRMAMNIVKYDAAKAQQWAEEAVLAGVVESKSQEIGVNATTGFSAMHPLKEIMNTWNDCRVNASFVSLLTSLQHPYVDYMLGNNSEDIINSSTGEVYTANTGIVGVRAGLRMEPSQAYMFNMRVAYSQFIGDDFFYMPVYAFKCAEMDFLRAEGALRGWSMGGDVATLYEQGIRHADCSDTFGYPTNNYDNRVDDYLKVSQAVPYTSVDPMDSANNIESVTKIGVKWDNSDDMETKLEKIITQKYIALFPYSYGAWSDMRRTGYPKIFPVLNPTLGNDGSLADGDLIRRLILPYGDTAAGTEDVQNTGLEAIGGADVYATRVFWDTEDANF